MTTTAIRTHAAAAAAKVGILLLDLSNWLDPIYLPDPPPMPALGLHPHTPTIPLAWAHSNDTLGHDQHQISLEWTGPTP